MISNPVEENDYLNNDKSYIESKFIGDKTFRYANTGKERIMVSA